MRGREFKDAIFQQFAKMASAFSSPKRVELIDLLAQGEHNVETLARESGLTVANTSRHLQILKNAHLVATRKDGLSVYYRLVGPEVLEGYRGLQALAEARLADLERLVREYFSSSDGLEPVDGNRLLKRVQDHDVTVIDVRPTEEFEAGHLAGAVSVPLRDLDAHLRNLPRDQEIVAYCRGRYCVLAAEAVRRLRAKGYRAARLEIGYPEWLLAGMPVEAETSDSAD